MALSPGHYALGFHSTATIGSLGAAAACARLLGLDAEADRDRARHRRDPGGRAQIAVRHDVQAVPCRQGGAERPLGGAPRRARVFEPHRPPRMRPGVRRDPRPGFLARGGAGRARGWLSHPRQPLQIPRRLLHDPRADRNRAPSAARTRAQPRPDRRHHPAARCRVRPDLQHPRPGRRVAEQVQPAPDRGDGLGRGRYREPRRLQRSECARPGADPAARADRRSIFSTAGRRPWPRSRLPSPTAGGSRRGTMPAFPRPTSPSRATASPPNSMSWSGRCSAPRAPASCGKRSAGSTPWPRSAASRGSPRASLSVAPHPPSPAAARGWVPPLPHCGRGCRAQRGG